jgi:hypothetical protein
MSKLNLVKKYRSYYSAGKKPEIVEFEPISYLTIVGKGEPAGIEFTKKVEALYPLAYGVKGYYKDQGNDFAVPKLEGLWWIDEGKDFFEASREEWRWKLLIRMPEFVINDAIERIKPDIIKKKNNELIGEIEFEELFEGKCVQIMHIGPYSTEHETVNLLMKFIKEQGLTVNGLHHEIYLSDPRKVPSDKMKTIIRYPVK